MIILFYCNLFILYARQDDLCLVHWIPFDRLNLQYSSLCPQFLYVLPKESTQEITKNVFYFAEKAYFVFKIFKFLYFTIPIFLHLSVIAELIGETD